MANTSMINAGDDENCSSFHDGKCEILTTEDVLIVARTIAGDELVRVLDYCVENYSKDKHGFTGSHNSLKIILQRSAVDRPEIVNIFLKGLPKNSSGKDDNEAYMPILMQESLFFEQIVPELMRDYKGEKWCPTYYVTTKNSIIMEDLKFSGYRVLEKIYDNPVVLKSVLASLARFHSCSILAEARLSRESKHPVTLNEYFKNSISEMMFTRNGEKTVWYSSGENLACDLAERLGYNPREIRDVFDRIYDFIKPSDTYRTVICHGDLHTNNVMFADNSPTYKTVLIDFQIIRYGPLVTDILQLLHLNASRQFREQFEVELVKHYHSVLDETVKMHDSTIEAPTLGSILQGLEDLRAYGLIVACLYMPLALLASKDCKDLTEDSEKFMNFMFGDRFERVLDRMRVDESYKSTVENAITELAEKAIG